MSMQIPLLVFTDLDGTLLDHDSYRWEAASPALNALALIGAGVVLASSKTAAEIIRLQQELNLSRWPAIVENGAGVIAPEANGVLQPERYQELRIALDQLPTALRQHFTGFGDLDIDGVAALTGLNREQANLARQRLYSEPGQWSGTDSQQIEFIEYLSQLGISVTRGGRYITLSHGMTKADRMVEIICSLNPLHTVALGDAPNDIEMIQTADFGVIVKNPYGVPLQTMDGEEDGHIFRTKQAGPAAWNTAILNLLLKLELHTH